MTRKDEKVPDVVYQASAVGNFLFASGAALVVAPATFVGNWIQQFGVAFLVFVAVFAVLTVASAVGLAWLENRASR